MSFKFPPALRCLGELAEVRPVVVIDTREQTPLPFSRLATTRGAVQSGDYSFRGGEEIFAIERKTIADLVGCCVGDSRQRFERELHRLRGFRFKRLLIVGSPEQIEAHGYISKVSPRSVMGSLATLEIHYDIAVAFADTPEAAGRLVERWIWYFAREITETANELARGCGLTRKSV